MSHFTSELYAHRAIDRLALCWDVAGDPFGMRRKKPFGTLVWQMKMPTLCQPSITRGVFPSQLDPDLRLRLKLAGAVGEAPGFV